MLFWALLASGQISLRRVDGWDTFHLPLAGSCPWKWCRSCG
jgi:hypothetical protein